MALTTTLLDEFALKYSQSKLDVYEHRMESYGAYETYRVDTPNLIPGYAELLGERKGPNRVVRVPVIQRATYSTTSARSCDYITKENTSTYVTPTWTTIMTGFSMYPAQYPGNYIGLRDDFLRKMEDVQRTFLDAVDTAAIAHLEANRSAVNNAANNPYAIVGSSMTVPKADNELFFNELGAVMAINDLPKQPTNIVATHRMQALVRQYSSQGTSNAENRAFQFGGYNFKYTGNISIPTADRDVLYSMPIGALGYLSWVDIDSQLGHKSSSGVEWKIQNLPLLGHDVGVLVQSKCDDKSSTIGTGFEATLVQSWQFSFDYSFLCSYNSDTVNLPGVIFKANFSKT